MFIFENEIFEKIFPFYIKFDNELIIVDTGKSIVKVLGEIKGKKFDEVFKFVRPKLSISANFESFIEHQDTIIIIEALEYPIKTAFRGQFVHDAATKQILYLNSPWITHTLDLELHNLLITDFALHDTMTDVMQLLRSKEIVNEDLIEVNDALRIQRDELIQSKNSLVEVSSRFRTLIESMNSGILAENKDRKIILVNDLFCKIFQIPVSPDQMVGMDCSSSAEETKHLFHDENGFIERINLILKNRTQVFGDLLPMKDGRILERDYVPIIENGKYAGHIWKYQDVTEIVKDKISIRNTEEKYRRIIENLKFGLIEVDNDEIITKVYPAFCELTGFSEEELIGQHARDMFSVPEDDEIMELQLEKRLQGESSVYERRLLTKSGEIKYFIISGAPIFNSDNQVVGSLGIHLDITERKNLEKELIQAKEFAIESMKMKEMFLANISHEIRTPMNAIIGLSDVLSETNLNEEQLKFLSAIRVSSTNLLSLINDILDFSKIESGKLELEKFPFIFSEMIDNLKEILSIKARQKSLDLNFEMDKKLAKVFNSDSLKLTQVLINLISNSLKFTEKGSVTLFVKVIHEDTQFQRIKFNIKDTGIGIDHSKLDKIFDTFNQEDISVSRKYGGTGLGLSISQGIIKAFGSEIRVISEKNVGSEFYFELTLEKGDVKNVMTDEIPNDVKSIEVPKDLHILIAEDNAFNQMLVKAIFDKLDFQFEIVDNGRQVLEAMDRKHFDLILMDIQMPEMDGITTTEYIRNKLNSTIPIIALTANAGKEDESVYLKTGMNGYLSKPFKKEELIEKISTLHKNRQLMNHKNYSLDKLLEIANGDEQFIIEMVNTFRSTIPNSIEGLVNALELKDYAKIQDIAHQIKPSIDIMGIENINALVRNLEIHCKNSVIDKHFVQDSIDKIKNEILLVLKQIDKDFE